LNYSSALRFLRRWWYPLLGFGVGALVGLGWRLFHQPRPLYVATAKLVASEEPGAPEQILLGEFRGTRKNKLLQAAARISSLDFLKQVAERWGKGDAGEVARALRSRVRVNLRSSREILGQGIVGEPDILEVSVIWDDPQAAVELARELVSLAVEDNLKLKTWQHQRELEFIREQMQAYSRELDQLTERMRRFQDSGGDVSQKRTALASKLADLEAELESLSAEEARLASLEAWATDKGELPGYAKFLISDERVSSLAWDAWETEAQLAAAQKELGPENPQVKELEAELKVKKKKLLEAIGDRRKAIESLRKGLLRKRESLREELRSLSKEELEYLKLLRRKEAVEDIYTLLAQRLEEVRIAQAGVTPDYTVLETPSEASQIRAGGGYFWFSLLGGGAGFTVGFLLLLLFAYLDTTLSGAEELRRRGYKVLVELPRVQDPLSDEVLPEKCKILAFMLGFVDGGRKLVSVTSPAAGEGKTVVSLNLAKAVASLGKRVLLVDMDHYKKALSKALGVDGFGVKEVVDGSLALEEALTKSEVEGIWVLPPGEGKVEDVRGLRALLRKLKEKEFDCVIVDTPPALLVAEAASVASVADAVVLVAAVGRTDTRDLANTWERLKGLGAKLSGVVVNMERAGRKYYSGYEYYRSSKGS